MGSSEERDRALVEDPLTDFEEVVSWHSKGPQGRSQDPGGTLGTLLLNQFVPP